MSIARNAELESNGMIHEESEVIMKFTKGVAIITGISLILSVIMVCPTEAKTKNIEYSEQELFERVVEAEAGNQGLIGKRLVAAVIYNRVESEKFPNTVYEVLTSPHQFSTVWNGAVDKIEVSDETRVAIILEQSLRSDEEILYFNNGECSGKFAFKYKGHNFGK